MTAEMVRRVCLGMPGVTESLQWGEHLVFKVGGKMFAIVNLDFAGNALSFKCTPEDFAELIEREGIIPGPHLARAGWVALENWDAMPVKEVNTRLRQAYDLVWAKLPAKTRAGLA